MNELIQRVVKSLEKSNEGISKLPEEIYGPNLIGMSSPKVRHFLNNLCSFPDTRYLEIGTYCGSTLLSASYDNDGTFFAIDNHTWSVSGDGLDIRKALNENRQQHSEHCVTSFLEEDCWSVDKTQLPCKFNVYFYDGDHSEDSQRSALTYYSDVVEDQFIYIVDDWRDRGPDQESGAMVGTYKGIKDAGLEIIYETEAPPGEYHVGLGIFVLGKRKGGGE